MNEIKNDFRGYLNINKPKGPSSFDVVRDVRSLLAEKRVGHAGTLDPLASGVLVVAVGRENTRNISKIQNQRKTYIATVKMGETSETDDREGRFTKININNIPSNDDIRDCINSFIGNIKQVPPAYSAKKINGQRAYKLARHKEKIILKPCRITIHDIKILKYKWPQLKIKVVCSKGTYIRSLARDIGNCLKTGAYLENLVRTAVGKYNLSDSINIK